MKEYRLGPHFFKYRNLCGILTSVVVFTFYFVYDYLFSGFFSWWNSNVMAFVFLLIGGIFLALIWFGANMIYQNVSYSITEEALVCISWKQTTQFPFPSFRQARLDMLHFSSAVPAVFELEDGKTLRLNRYIGELPELTSQLLEKIVPYAQIDDQLLEYVNACTRS